MQKISFTLIALLLFQLISFAQPAPRRVIVQPGRPGNGGKQWVFIAKTEVRLNATRDVVNFNNNNKFRAIKFEVSRNPIEVYNLNVVFQNGKRQSFQVKNNFLPGSSSRSLDFPGQARRLKQIIIDYRSRGHLFNQRAYMDIYGLL